MQKVQSTDGTGFESGMKEMWYLDSLYSLIWYPPWQNSEDIQQFSIVLMFMSHLGLCTSGTVTEAVGTSGSCAERKAK